MFNNNFLFVRFGRDHVVAAALHQLQVVVDRSPNNMDPKYDFH